MTSIQEEFSIDLSIDLGDENYDCWAAERNAILALAEEVKAAKSLAEGLVAIDKSLRYFLTIESYLRANSDCYKRLCATVYKLMQTPDASPLLFTILETEKFLLDLRPPTFAELAARYETKAVAEEDVEEEEKQAVEEEEEKEETETWLCHMREARLVDSEKFAELLLALQKGMARKEIAARVFAPAAPAAVLGAEEERKKNAAVAAALARAWERIKAKVWGTLPYITDADFARYLDGQLPIEATERAFGDMEFFIWTRGLATYKLDRQSSAEKGCFVEELSGGANPCFLRPFPIDLHSEEGRAAFAAGKPLPHPSAVKANRSWWSRFFLCGTVAVETH